MLLFYFWMGCNVIVWHSVAGGLGLLCIALT